jgi:type IV pilus assembly protein PilO
VSVFTSLKTGNGNTGERLRSWLSPLNLHWAGVGLLALVNVYFLVQMALLWHASSQYDANAVAEQKIELKTAEIAAVPLRGLDTKVATATAEADRFYRDRLPGSESEMLSELGVLTKKAGVRLVRNSYQSVTVLPGAPGELSEIRMDATLSGDYRPLMLMVNSLERDKMFFAINAVTLTGQQTGTVNLRLRLTTFLRPNGSGELTAPSDSAASGEGMTEPATAAGGPGR